MGYTAVQLPPVILRNMLENPCRYTAYTPISRKSLRLRLEGCQLPTVGRWTLTGLDMASASSADEATAAAEAMGDGKARQQIENAATGSLSP